LYIWCFFFLLFIFSLASLSLDEVLGAKSTGIEEKERHAVVRGTETEVNDERKDDVVDLHKVLVTADSPRDTSMINEESRN
jgi:hypothetical protein